MKYVVLPLIEWIEFGFRFLVFLFAGFWFYFGYYVTWFWHWEKPKFFIFWKDIDEDDFWEYDVIYFTPLDFLLSRKRSRNEVDREYWDHKY